MIELAFVDAVATSLSVALVAIKGTGIDTEPLELLDSPNTVQRICRMAAMQLLTDFDGKTLLDIALDKLQAEQRGVISTAATASA
jgi:hypothetical protein